MVKRATSLINANFEISKVMAVEEDTVGEDVEEKVEHFILELAVYLAVSQVVDFKGEAAVVVLVVAVLCATSPGTVHPSALW